MDSLNRERRTRFFAERGFVERYPMQFFRIRLRKGCMHIVEQADSGTWYARTAEVTGANAGYLCRGPDYVTVYVYAETIGWERDTSAMAYDNCLKVGY
ncbi:hypothetical protein D3C81_759340 [compost metagenome]